MDCFNQSNIDRIERSSSFPVEDDFIDAAKTKLQLRQDTVQPTAQETTSTCDGSRTLSTNLKKQPQVRPLQKKRVRFSEMSSMLCYEHHPGPLNTALYNTKADYVQMKSDSYNTALAIRTIIQSSPSLLSASSTSPSPGRSNSIQASFSTTTQTAKRSLERCSSLQVQPPQQQTKIRRYTQAYNALPSKLEAHGVDFTDVIGIEHLCIPRKVFRVTLALRKKVRATLLEEQSRLRMQGQQQHETHEGEDICNQEESKLSECIKPVTRISRHLARERAWNVARSIVEDV